MSEESLSSGERVKILRERAQLNQDLVAKKLGVPKSALIAFEKNRLSEEKIEAVIAEFRQEAA